MALTPSLKVSSLVVMGWLQPLLFRMSQNGSKIICHCVYLQDRLMPLFIQKDRVMVCSLQSSISILMFKVYALFIIMFAPTHSKCLTILFTSISYLVSLPLSQVFAPSQLSVYVITHLSILVSSKKSSLLSLSITQSLFIDVLLYSFNTVSTLELY